MSWTVDLADLRAALVSVLPHVTTDKDDLVFRRVRLDPRGGDVEVSATDRFSTALALVSVVDCDGDAELVDLPFEVVRQLLAVFPKPGKDEQVTVQVESRRGAAGSEVEFVDVSGMLPGVRLVLPRAEHDPAFPSVRAFLAGLLTPGWGEASLAETRGEWVSGLLLARFAKASAAYDEPLVLAPGPARTSGISPVMWPAWTVRCGESFAGSLATYGPDPQDLEAAEVSRRRWADRLGSGVTLTDLARVTAADLVGK